jgi:DNA-binding MarR family transcriptional regulator
MMSNSNRLSAEQITRELMTVLPLLNRLIGQELRAETGDETTIVQLRVLSQLMESPMTLSALAKTRRVSLQAASEHVQGLVDRGWVTRVADANDRRQSVLHVTEDGRQQVEAAQECIVNYLTPMMENLVAGEAEAVHDALLALKRILVVEESVPTHDKQPVDLTE